MARVVARMIDRAAAEGMNREALVEAAGLRDVDLADGDSRVPVSVQAALWRLIAKGIPDPGFAVRAGASMKVRETGLLGYVMSYSATLGDALRRLVRYSHILTDAVEFRLEPPRRQHVAIAQCHPALGVGLPFAVDYRLAAGLSISRQITGVGIVPFEIDFSYEQPASTLEHRRVFRCPLRFGQPKSGVILFERDLSLPVPQGDETLAGYLTAYAEEVLRSLVSGPSIRERVRSAIWTALADGRPTLRGIASALRDIIPAVLDMRPVIFVTLRPAPGEPLFAYVSAGARGLAAHISGGTTVDPTPVSVGDLPRGLTMLFGEGVDAAEYEKRHA